MTLPRPRTPKEFFALARRLAREGRERDLLALEERYAAEFFGRFTPDQRNRLEGIFESAHNIIDLQEWAAQPEHTDGVAHGHATAEQAASISAR